MKIRNKIKAGLAAIAAVVAMPTLAFAEAGHEAAEHVAEHEEASHAVIHFGLVFAMFALVLVAGKIGNAVERWGIPAVLGELLIGIGLSAAAYFGWGFIDDVRASEVIAFISSFGALVLLFSIGLESNMHEIKKTGVNALLVALIGVVVPFVLGAYILGPLFYGDEESTARLFLGASLVATSVGITASVFRTMKIQKSRAAQTVLGAAVIDDVLGLIILAIVSALAAGGEISAGLVLELGLKSFGFLAGALLIGSFLTAPLSKLFSKIHAGIGMKVSLALGFALIFGFLAEEFGLEPIIGAFAAGLLLDAVHFDDFADPEVVDDLKALEFTDKKDREKVLRVINKHKHAHIEDLVASIGLVFIPVFFVYTGLQIEFGSLLEPKLYLIAGIISVLAILGKMASGLGAKGTMNEKLLVGSSMVPRGEVGLIFAATGRGLGVLSDELFSVIILVVVFTTFIGPGLIKTFAQKLHPAK